MGHCLASRLNVANLVKKLTSLLALLLVVFNFSLVQICLSKSIEFENVTTTASPSSTSITTIKNLTATVINVTTEKTAVDATSSTKTAEDDLVEQEKRFSNGHQNKPTSVEKADLLSAVSSPTLDTVTSSPSTKQYGTGISGE